jgi:hypothetical protein
MEVDQNHDLVLARLEDGIFDVVVHDVYDLTSRRDEAKAVRMRFQVTLRLATRKHRAHRQISEARDTLILCSNEFFLLN